MPTDRLKTSTNEKPREYGATVRLKISSITAAAASDAATAAMVRVRLAYRLVMSAHSGMMTIHVGRTKANRHSVAAPVTVIQVRGGDASTFANSAAMTMAPAW